MKNDGRNDSKSFRKGLLIMAGVALVSITLAGLTESMILRSFVDPLIGERFNLRNLGFELRAHAGANYGHFPERLDDLSSRASLLKYHDIRTKRGEAWTYFSGYGWNDRTDTIIAATPRTFSNKDGTRMVGDGEFRMVLTLDGRTLFVKEHEYLELLKEQQGDGWQSSNKEKQLDPWSFLSGAAWKKWEQSQFSPEHGVEDVPRLIQLMSRGKKHERWNASDELIEIRPVLPEVVPALLSALDDSDTGYLAAQGLAVMSLQDESIIPRLAEIVETSSGKARYWATVSLKEIGLQNARIAIPAVINELSGEDDLPTSAAKAVAGAGPNAVDAVPQLIEMTGMGTTWDCKCAIIALGRIGPPAAEATPVLSAMFDAGHEYRLDIARALWKIDPIQVGKLVPELILQVESQRNPEGPNRGFTNDDFSAIELMGEIGPEVGEAVPILEANLKGSARLESAWSLWRIEPSMRNSMAPILARYLRTSEPEHDRFAQQQEAAPGFSYSFPSRLMAFGALWQMHPEQRPAMSPILVALLHEWESEKVLKSLPTGTRTAVPALEAFIEQKPDSEQVLLAQEMMRKIKTSDPGDW